MVQRPRTGKRVCESLELWSVPQGDPAWPGVESGAGPGLFTLPRRALCCELATEGGAESGGAGVTWEEMLLPPPPPMDFQKGE